MTDTVKTQLREANVTEINYPDVVGWEWTGEPWTESETGISHPGLAHSLVWDRHNHWFMYSTKREHDGKWIITKCQGDLWEGADTLAKARAIAAYFINPTEGQTAP